MRSGDDEVFMVGILAVVIVFISLMGFTALMALKSPPPTTQVSR